MPHATASPVVLITGCSSGIGRATALLLASRGWTVYATARRVESLTDLANSGCRTLQLDVDDEASMSSAVTRLLDESGRIDALVNNAGYSQSGAIESVPVGRIRGQFETNVFGPVRLTQLVLPAMRASRHGRVVILGSMGGRLTFPGGGIYHATKYALEAVADALRFELAGFGIPVVLVQPGLIRTRFTETVSTQMAALGAEPSGPYGPFNAEVERVTRESYVKGPMASLTSSAEDVARVVERALTATHPKARYRVGASATLLMTLRAILPDRMWDAFLGRTYPRPGASR